jgi:hypothetical protein
MDLFDFAEPSLVVADRDSTNVPAQALYLMNNEGILQISRAFALRLLTEAGPGPRERIDRAYRLAFGRPPTPREVMRAGEFLRSELGDVASNPGPGSSTATERRRRNGPRTREVQGSGIGVWTSFAQALLASAEFRFLH